MRRIGLVSDTHGLVRPEVLAFLEGCDHLVHAGDVCDAAVLERLRAIAPLTAVRGNNDRGAWADRLRERETLEVEGARLLVVHDLA
ncbi:MAG TPA: metallophosphoesterase family protein, partial [Nevskiaceae bacterium]|nr:metallophosphoesterase family protein [Nevskiaceae bacterium]